MHKTITKNTQAFSKTILAITLVIIVAATGIIAAYYFTHQNTDNTQTQTSESKYITTAFFDSKKPYEDYKTTLQYKGQMYNGTHPENITVFGTYSEENYAGVNCWKFKYGLTSETMPTTFSTLYVSKATLTTIHYSVVQYNWMGNLTYQDDYAVNSSQKMIGYLLTQPVDEHALTGYGDVTVEAGNYANCAKAEFTDGTQTVHAWISPNVAGWGIVKMEIYQGQTLTMTMELSA
ncbi:MAG: hypothetical protein ACQCN6_12405 [Candidatus Bathyarchaeia archaeon]|jgi:hypothetical protein